MGTNTNNIGLYLYDGNERMNITGESNSLNSNMKIIDTNIKSLEDSVGSINSALERIGDGADGKSAFEIAQEQDPSLLTVEQWLNSLKGADGVTPNIQAGDVTALPFGSDPTVGVRKENEYVYLDFGIPKGGSEGGGVSAGYGDNFSFTRITPQLQVLPYDSEVDISFEFRCYDSSPDEVTIGCDYVLSIEGTPIASGPLQQGTVNFTGLGKHFPNKDKTFTVTLRVTTENGTVKNYTWKVQKVNVRLESPFNDKQARPIDTPIDFTYKPYGAIDKTIHIKVDGEEQTFTDPSSGSVRTRRLSGMSRGAHQVEAWITAQIGGNEIETPHIFKDIVCYQTEDTVNRTPVIGCSMRTTHRERITVRQYDTTQIEYVVFDPGKNPTIERYIDGVLAGTEKLMCDNLTESATGTWEYKSSDASEHTLLIKCGETTVTIVVNVTSLNLDVDPVNITPKIDFNPVGKSNSSTDRLWTSSDNKIHMTVSDNFDWANGGYQLDEDGNTYFLIKSNTYATFDYKMFEESATNPKVNGAEMKIVFMVENVKDVNGIWFSNAETKMVQKEFDVLDESGKATGEKEMRDVEQNIGIKLGVHNGWLKTNLAGQTKRGSTSLATSNSYLYMPYSEDDIIELDINISPLEQGKTDAFVMSYEDGVPSKAYSYTNEDNFQQLTSPQDIVIGSPDCDVRIYRLKVYNVGLDTEDIMRNFIADSRDSTTMISRYERNSIYYNADEEKYYPYSSMGTLSPETLAKVIPNVKVLMLETDVMTNDKKDFRRSSLRCIHADGGEKFRADPILDNWKLENGYHSGQGTTSNKYGVAARNIDFLFNCDGQHKPSDKVKADASYISKLTLGYGTNGDEEYQTCTDWKGDSGKVSLTRTSVPNNFFNLKVNVASSENVNNALLAKRYNDYLVQHVYESLGHKHNPFVKNNMEFVPAVLFVKENKFDPNLEIGDANRVENPDLSRREFDDGEWHFYALGNIGDSKKTDYTRAYDKSDMAEFTIEISDNNKNNAAFQSGVQRNPDGSYTVEEFYITKSLNSDNEVVVVPTPTVTITDHLRTLADEDGTLIANYWNKRGRIKVINKTGDPANDGPYKEEDDDSNVSYIDGYINMRHWALENEGFDGDHSFEPRYACCGDYRDGKLVNDTNGTIVVEGQSKPVSVNKLQIETNNDVWRAFYEWVITSSDTEFVEYLDEWCVRDAVEFFYLFTHNYTMMDNRAKNTFWHFGKTGEYREVHKPVPQLLHVYCEKDESGEEVVYRPVTEKEIIPEKTYYTQHAFDLWIYDCDTGLGINNNGELIFPYGREDIDYTIDGDPNSGYVFNAAKSIFWCRLRDLCGSEIGRLYRNIANTTACFDSSSLINEFESFQDCFPEELWRLDIQRKYIRTFTGESIDNSLTQTTENGVTVYKKDPQFLSNMMQGRKKYQRRQWVKDQTIYFGTKYQTNAVKADGITFRCFDPGASAVPANYNIRITPYSDMYLSVEFANSGNDSPVRTQRAKAGVEYLIESDSSTMFETQVSIYAGSRIQALSDLSACYIGANSFANAIKLKELVIGNPTPGYSNARLDKLTLGNNKLLEKLDVRNCSSLEKALDLTEFSNLKTLLAGGSAVSGIVLPPNGPVETLQLPENITSLSMLNLSKLYPYDEETGKGFTGSLRSLQSLTIGGGNLGGTTVGDRIYNVNLGIVQDTLDTLTRLQAYDLDWVVDSQDILNEIMKITSRETVLTGHVDITGPIRDNELDAYNARWTGLNVTYDGKIDQYNVTYLNANGEELAVIPTDINTKPVRPEQTGVISTPTLPSTAEFDYEFTGWTENIDQYVTNNMTITATYNPIRRRYNIYWYDSENSVTPIYETTAYYGEEVNYPSDRALPSLNQEQNKIYNVFGGWNNSTGFIKGETHVRPIWHTVKTLNSIVDETSVEGKVKPLKELNNLTHAELYALNRNYASLKEKNGNVEIYPLRTSYEVTLGNDFNFNNVEQQVLVAEDTKFDGRFFQDTGLRLFDRDAPSFTIAIDAEFCPRPSTVSGKNEQVLMCCGDQIGNKGFRLSISENSHPRIIWGNEQNIQVANGYNRFMLVLRHVKGENARTLHIYTDTDTSVAGMGRPNIYADEISVRSRTRNTDPSSSAETPYTTEELTLGCLKDAQGGRDFFACGIIHWCKIWKDDLGDANCRELAAWPHQKIKMDFVGSNKYSVGESGYGNNTQMSFLAAEALPYTYRFGSATKGNKSWTRFITDEETKVTTELPSDIKAFLNSRLYNAFPITLRGVLANARLGSQVGYNQQIVYSTSKIYLPALAELIKFRTDNYGYTDEGVTIAYFESAAQRVRFPSIPVPANSRAYSSSNDPSNGDNLIKQGDIWQPTNTYGLSYIYCTHEFINGRTRIGSSNLSEWKSTLDGRGYWIPAVSWWTRTPEMTTEGFIKYIDTYGTYSSSAASVDYVGQNHIVFGFSL